MYKISRTLPFTVKTLLRLKSQERVEVVILILRDLGLSWEKIREKMRFSNKSTAQTIYENYLKNGRVDDAKSSGRSPNLTQKDQNWLRRIVIKNNKASLRKTSCSIQQFQHENCFYKDKSTKFEQNGPCRPCHCKEASNESRNQCYSTALGNAET